ncbi:MAG: hypothetical protein DRN27_01625 [Thermoplasmata archaeon]|nr:MAG: hypothetical protein DRN27_01625 [Thermoplasmata archaeon]
MLIKKSDVKMVENQNMKVKGIVVVIILIITGAAFTTLLIPTVESTHSYNVNVFSSYDELFSFYNDLASNEYSYSIGFDDMLGGQRFSTPKAVMESSSMDSNSASGSSDESSSYSSTNVQVEGVDEPDIVKTDGSYIYVVSGQEIFIVKAYPPVDSEIVSTLSLESFSVSNIFINDNYLIVFGTPYNTQSYYNEPIDDDEKSTNGLSYTPYYYKPSTKIIIYDLSTIEEPVEHKTIEMDGYYFNARMIGDYVYVISIQNNYNIYPLMEENQSYAIPTIKVDNETRMVPPTDIHYIDSEEPVETTTHIASIDLTDMTVTQKSFILGCSQSLYASENNIYLASQHYFHPRLFSGNSISSGNEQMMIIHKISLDGTTINYEVKGEVPGRILNQFSMDEHDGYFRIATTTGNNWNTDQQLANNIFVLNSDLEQIGEIEDIAPGEQIHSARFMGEKAYLVTFKKIDPFFTIDLSDPYDPQILGKLKIPGYSDYLHPYDENHIIGIGKNTVEALDEESWREIDFSWYQGIKIALFDVSDFENPIELSKIIIGDRGTSSPALYDHKAFLFDFEKNLLVIPVDLYEIDEEIKEKQGNYTGSIYGDFTYQGAYIYNLSVEEGFNLTGRITHLSDEDMKKSGFYPLYEKSITRTLYIDDFLYTISQGMIKINDLESLNEENSITLE